MQKSFIVKSKKLSLMGTLHLPDDYKTSVKKYQGVILFHGFTGTKIEPHRLFWKISDMLKNRDIISLRFDYRGNGESEGNFEDFTIKDYIYDAKIILKKMLKKIKKIDENNITLIGLSMGGIVTSYITAQFPQIKKIVLLSAVAKPKEVFFNDMEEHFPNFKEKYKNNETFDIGGNCLTKKFLDTIKRMKPLEKIKDFTGKALIIHNQGDTTVTIDNAEAYNKIIENSELHIINGESHTFANLEQEKQVFDLIKNFI